MAVLEMNGSFELTNDEIDKQVKEMKAGNYAVGWIKNKTFIVKYVGRSDSDLNDRLKDHVGDYERFKFSYADSPTEAFEKECKNYHDFGKAEKLDNSIHPDRPDGTKLACPICDALDL